MQPQQTIRVDHYAEPEELAAAIPGMQLRATPLARGKFHASLTTWSLDGLVFQTGACPPLFIEFMVQPDHAVLQLPLLNRRDLVLNGRPAGAHGVGLYGGGAELLRANHLPGSYATFILPLQSVEALLAPPASLALAHPGAAGMLVLQPAAWRRLAALVRLAIRAGQDEAVPHFDPARAGLRASFLDAARAALAQGGDAENRRRLAARSGWLRLVKGAEDYLQAHAARAIYTEELCAALHVSPAGLMEAFRQVMGTTPHRFLKQRRLAMVRAALRAPAKAPPLVKTVALSHGFWHLGQFSLDYREAYGETPSETLAQAHPAAGQPLLSRAS